MLDEKMTKNHGKDDGVAGVLETTEQKDMRKGPDSALRLPALIKKAAAIFLIVFIIYALSYASGFVAGKAKWVDYNDLMKSPVLQLSRNLEYKVPGYGDLLKAYRNWHNNCRNAYLMTSNKWGLGTLIYINNVFAANLTMIVRALFVFPLALTIFSKFFQGVMFAQMPGSGRMLTIFIMEFGGYFLTICGTLVLVLWTIFYRAFKFNARKEAFIGGLKILGLAYILSCVGMLVGSILETRLIFRMMGG